jgi:GT2 family glycosyltransferase
LRSHHEPEKFEYAGAAGGYLDRNGYPYCRGRIFDTCETDNGQYDDVAEVFWATGAALMVRTELYKKVGGLDAKFFAHMEEIDLCWRIKLAGYHLVAIPTSCVYHLGGGSLPASNPRKTYLNFRNNLLMLHKNLPDSDRKSALVRRRLLDTIAWVKFIVTFDFGNAGAILRAHRDFARMAREYTTHPEVNLLKADKNSRRNILIEYYLKGHKTFSSLR